MKIVTVSAIALIAATPAFAGSLTLYPAEEIEISAAPAFGGHITAYYGVSSVEEITGNEDYHGDFFDRIGVEGSIGSARNGGFGWQIDGQYETANFTDGTDPFADTYALTAHGYTDLAGFSVGGFAGVGLGNFTTHLDSAANAYWYGLDVAKTFGDFAVAGQLGFATTNNEDTGLSSENKMFATLEGRYFIGENLMVGANVGFGSGQVYNYDLAYTEWGVDVTTRLGQSNFYATAGYFGSSADLENYNTGLEQNVFVGISMLFGGGLRDIYAGATPMVGHSMVPYIGVTTVVNAD